MAFSVHILLLLNYLVAKNRSFSIGKDPAVQVCGQLFDNIRSKRFVSLFIRLMILHVAF